MSRPTAVVPEPHTSSTGPAVSYEMRASAAQLPLIDCSKGIKNVLLSAVWLRRCNAFLHGYKGVIGAATYTGGLLGASSFFCPAFFARIFAVVCMVLTLPGIVAGILVLRFDMVRVLLRTYEFWYVSVANALAMLLIAVHFNDLRACTMFSAGLGFQITILIDASYRAVSTTQFGSVVAAFTMSVFIVVVLLGLVNDSNNPAIVQYGPRVVSVVDGIANALATVVVMLLRNTFRKYLVDREGGFGSIAPSSTVPTVRCITYRCRVRLWLTSDAMSSTTATSPGKTSAIHPHRLLVRENSTNRPLSTPSSQLQLIAIRETFDPSHTVFSFVYQPLLRPIKRRWRIALHVLQAVGMWGNVLVLAPQPPNNHDAPSCLLPLVPFASTVVFCGAYAIHQQRRLLCRLCSSFDFVYVSTQLSLAHLCVCDAFYWDVRCLIVLSSWLWVHWVLTLDSITPVMRTRLGYRRLPACVVVILFITAHILLSLELVVWRHWQLQDRAVVHAVLWGRDVRVRVVPMLFGRMITTFCWSLRLLMRLIKRSNDELIMLQGPVMYEDVQRERRRKSSASSIQPPT